MDTRESDEGDSIRRRRRCASCDKRFTTYERAELTLPAIVKKNGSRVEYSHDKLISSIRLALRKRPVSADAVDEAVGRIEEKLLSLGEKKFRVSASVSWWCANLNALIRWPIFGLLRYIAVLLILSRLKAP